MTPERRIQKREAAKAARRQLWKDDPAAARKLKREDNLRKFVRQAQQQSKPDIWEVAGEWAGAAFLFAFVAAVALGIVFGDRLP